MLNSLMSQQLPIQSIQMGQVEPMSNKFNSSLQMGIMGQRNDGPSQQFSVGSMQMGTMGAVSTDVQSHQTSASNNQVQPLDNMPNNLVMQKLSVASMHIGHLDSQANNLMPEHSSNTGSRQSTVLTKRKAPPEASSNSPGLQKLSMPNKSIAMENRPWLQHVSSPKKLPVQSQPFSNTISLQRSHLPSKRSTSSKPGPQQLATQRNPSGQPSPKVQSESLESVRSKLRESLAAALALVSQEQDTPLGKNSGKEGSNTAETMQGSTQTCGDDSGTTDTGNHLSKEPKGSLSAKEDPVAQKHNCVNAAAQEVSSNNFGDCSQTSKNDAESTISMRDEDSSFSDCFFVKDELLQGNGLSWVLETDMGMVVENAKKQPNPEDYCHVSGGPAVPSPQVMASEIEAELYKLFGGVNKKYKEKGRSLLFNLKDRNNPELRARVMSGEIPPEKLCSMTAEELASKELSEWRMAKAEELAQMVVLPDTDVDMRRLVKKTHKGEFQVEVEPEDSVSIEVAIGRSSLSQERPKSQEKEASSLKSGRLKDRRNAAKEKSSTEHKNVLMIPSNEGNDLMQGLMVDDDLKDVEFLPPIVSLDEFMESLDTEPPFENLSVDNGKTSPVSDKDDSQASLVSKSPDAILTHPYDTSSGKADVIASGQAKSDTNDKSSDDCTKLEKIPLVCIPKGERVWEGLLSLNISAMASVIGIFKSGEKTSANDWPGLIEIKGRVRLDAFEKFLQELPMSRSRAVMALHFVCKDGPAGSENAGLGEVADSYVADSRVGFSEPAPGVELYFCPSHAKTCEMLGKVLPKDQVDALTAIDNGLIGVVVWRKPHIVSAISPNSTSHKHNSKKQHITSRRHQERDAIASVNMNVNVAAKQPFPTDDNDDEGDDDDDLPPGFGPPATRDEDDLPEFNFLSGSATPRSQFPTQSVIQGQGMAHFHPNSQTHSRPVDQMRELVHRYGQPKTGPPPGNWHDKRGGGVVVQPWDDDDDMPEWRPEDNKPQVPHPHPHPQTVHPQPPILRPTMGHETSHQQMPHPAMPLRPMLAPETPQQMAQPGMAVQPQRNVGHGPQYTTPQWQQGPWMVQQSGGGSWQQGPWMVPNSGGGIYQNNGGQFYGGSGVEPGQHAMAWRSDAPASRGF